MSTAVLTAVVGLVGAVVGAVLTALLGFFSQRAADKRRWEREDRTRHHQERLAAYRNMLAAISVERFGFVPDDEVAGYWVNDRALQEGVQAVNTCHSEILLLVSSEKVRLTSHRINNAAILLRRNRGHIHEREPLTDQELDAWTGPVLEARKEFLAAVREELGIESQTS